MNIYDIIAWVIVLWAFAIAIYKIAKSIKFFSKGESACAQCPLKQGCAVKNIKKQQNNFYPINKIRID